MKKKFFVLFLVCTFASCKNKSIEALENGREPGEIFAYLCTPANPGECLPLTIISTKFGWRAFYGAVPELLYIDSTDGIMLEPYVVKNDSIYIESGFIEYVDGNVGVMDKN